MTYLLMANETKLKTIEIGMPFLKQNPIAEYNYLRIQTKIIVVVSFEPTPP